MQIQEQTQQQLNYERITQAIEYIRLHFRQQPGLEEIAHAVHLSPAHFQRVFTEWAGTSPKKFLQYISLDHAQKVLRDSSSHSTLLDATMETGLSSTSRLHDLFVQMEGMSPATYKNGGQNLIIHYHFTESPFGQLLIASTDKGICYMAFEKHRQTGLQNLVSHFPAATFQEKTDIMQQKALHIFETDKTALSKIKLDLKGTPFQLKVWGALLRIPMGQRTTYGAVAKAIGQPGASRAVGTAIGNNPICFLIPCHRVIQATGVIGGYKWGSVRKTAILGWESAIMADLPTD